MTYVDLQFKTYSKNSTVSKQISKNTAEALYILLYFDFFPESRGGGSSFPFKFCLLCLTPGGIDGFAEKCTDRALKFAVPRERFENLQ